MTTTVVIGAGVAGLASAWFLRRAGHDVVVLEAAERAGGHVRTERRDGFVIECGPESIRGGNAALSDLLSGLGLMDRVLPASSASKARYLLKDGALHPLPSSPLGALRTPLFRRRAVLRALLEPAVSAGGHRPEETVYRFMRRRLGRRMADTIADPLMAGIYGGDPHRLEAASCLARFVEWEQEHGGLIRGAMASGPAPEPTGSFTFPTGVSELVEALTDALGDVVRLGDGAAALHRDGALQVETASGDRLAADRVVITCASTVAEGLLPGVALPSAPRAPVTAVHLGYRGPDIPGGLPGFGWLAHSRERRDVLGCLWVSGTFPSHAPDGTHLVRLMVGGTRAPELAELGDDAVVDHVRTVLREVQGVTAAPVLTHVARAIPGIPQYPPGFSGRVRRLRERLGPEVQFAGWFWGGIGLADGIQSARALAG